MALSSDVSFSKQYGRYSYHRWHGVLPQNQASWHGPRLYRQVSLNWPAVFIETHFSHRSFNQIISRTVQSNALSLLSQVVTIALFKANVGMYFFLNDFTIVKVYTFSLLISLNARRGSTMLGSVTESRSGGMPMGNLAGPTGRNTTRLGNNLSGTNHVLAVQVRYVSSHALLSRLCR